MEMLSRGEAEQRVQERAACDRAFRTELKTNPRAALQSELGVRIPQQITVQVHEESPSQFHLVLPATEEQLSDADLELVSGGGCWADCPSDSCPTDTF